MKWLKTLIFCVNCVICINNSSMISLVTAKSKRILHRKKVMVCGTCARFRWYWHSSGMVFTIFCCAPDDANFWSSRHIIENSPWDELVVSDLNLNGDQQLFFVLCFWSSLVRVCFFCVCWESYCEWMYICKVE